MQRTRQASIGNRLMAVFAHPDDEGQVAGIMAKYASEGIEVSLACATRGELGATVDPSLLHGRTMAQLRAEELRCVSDALGVKRLRFLEYEEGLFHLADSDEVDRKVIEIMQEFAPQVVITFGPEGVYGHRDHIAISRSVTSAFHAVRQKWRSQGLEFPLKLYYTAYPRNLFDGLCDQGIEFSIKISGAVHTIEGVPDEKITTIIDVSDFRSQKIKAFQCHRSQLRPGDFRWMIMEGRLVELLETERLVRVFPSTPGSGGIETDLFH